MTIPDNHKQFFRELKELVQKHNVCIMNSSDYLIFSFKGKVIGRYYQTADPLMASDFNNTFYEIELVTTEKVEL